jgi:hypothetical protein
MKVIPYFQDLLQENCTKKEPEKTSNELVVLGLKDYVSLKSNRLVIVLFC